jgi:hypothetical protein
MSDMRFLELVKRQGTNLRIVEIFFGKTVSCVTEAVSDIALWFKITKAFNNR